MDTKKLTASLLFSLFVFTACGGPKNTDKAAQAMERARAAEAPRYAPEEFAKAGDLYRKMTEAVQAKQNKEASAYADQTVTAANEAAARARENKATLLIGELASLLNEAQKQGLAKSNGQVYNQAVQSHIDATGFRDAGDYEKAIKAAQMGIDLLKPVVQQNSSEARELLEKARNRHSALSSSPNAAQYRNPLDEAAEEIRLGTVGFDLGDMITAKDHAQKALDILDELAALLGESGAARRPVNNDSLQLQAYQLIRQLGQTIDYLKKNGYTNDVTLGARDSNAAPAQVANQAAATAPAAQSPAAEEEIFLFMEEEEPMLEEDALSQAPLLFRAAEVITFAMIEGKYAEADKAYQEGNFINAIDNAREGLRLADLYLSAQAMAMHTVIKGDTLWDISGRYYKRNYFLWPNIWNANKLKIKDPDLIYPKQVFRIPPAPMPAK